MSRSILLIFTILGSCSLFTDYPEPIQAAQRSTYAGLQLLETNYAETVDYWVTQQIKIITYYENYIAQMRIDRAASDVEKDSINAEMNKNLNNYKEKLAALSEDQKTKSKKNFILVKQLAEGVYNYISTSPISLDNIDFLINQAKELIKK